MIKYDGPEIFLSLGRCPHSFHKLEPEQAVSKPQLLRSTPFEHCSCTLQRLTFPVVAFFPCKPSGVDNSSAIVQRMIDSWL